MSRSRRLVSDGGLEVLRYLEKLSPGVELDWADAGARVGQSARRLGVTLLTLERRGLIRVAPGRVYLTRNARLLLSATYSRRGVIPPTADVDP